MSNADGTLLASLANALKPYLTHNVLLASVAVALSLPQVALADAQRVMPDASYPDRQAIRYFG